jgi:hypothetical protein
MELTCSGCQHRLRVGDDAIGKRVRCPQCNEIQYVPVEERPAATQQSIGQQPTGQQPAGSASFSPETWRMRDQRGNEYGPVSRTELNQWVAEGRVTSDSQLLCSLTGHWTWAGDVYPAIRNSMGNQNSLGSLGYGRSPAGAPGTEYSDKSKVVAGLLGLFLGYLGIHRFYLGYPLIGVLMLVTFGMCGIWSFIDSLMILLGSVPDADGRPLRD